MRTRTTAIALLLAVFSFYATSSHAQELLAPIDGNRAARLSEYNSDFLTKELYFASRHRIVRVDARMLRGDEITITPFADIPPIRIKRTSVHETDGGIYWSGTMFDETAVFISTLAWDVDPSGIASPSNSNRPSAWRINQQGVPVLDVTPNGPPGIAGPPPQTAEQIEEVRRLQNLARKAFHSVEAIVATPDGRRYAVKPLEYVPRYSVVYEIDPDKELNRPRDSSSPDNRSESEKQRGREYAEIARRLPAGSKPTRGDLE